MSQDGQVALWSWTPDDVYVMAGPSYHAAHGGWASTALYVGATTVILPSWNARAWLGLVERHRATRSFFVPAHFIRLLEVPDDERAGYDISSLRLIVHAAAPCPVAVKRRIMDALAPAAIHELYGASEGGATRISPDEWLAHPGSVGKPWPGVEVRVLDDAGAPVATGEQGLIYVTPMGSWKFHYHNDPDKTSSAWRDDAFTVGDIGYLDGEGYLYITDRGIRHGAVGWSEHRAARGRRGAAHPSRRRRLCGLRCTGRARRRAPQSRGGGPAGPHLDEALAAHVRRAPGGLQGAA